MLKWNATTHAHTVGDLQGHCSKMTGRVVKPETTKRNPEAVTVTTTMATASSSDQRRTTTPTGKSTINRSLDIQACQAWNRICRTMKFSRDVAKGEFHGIYSR